MSGLTQRHPFLLRLSRDYVCAVAMLPAGATSTQRPTRKMDAIETTFLGLSSLGHIRHKGPEPFIVPKLGDLLVGDRFNPLLEVLSVFRSTIPNLGMTVRKNLNVVYQVAKVQIESLECHCWLVQQCFEGGLSVTVLPGWIAGE